jgi:hypothetical protein
MQLSIHPLKCFMILAIANLVSGEFTGLSLAQDQRTRGSFELAPGIVVDLNANRAYVMEPEGGIAALSLARGDKLWSSAAAAKPLTISGNFLVSQGESQEGANEIKIVTLDTEDKGRQVLAQTVPLPASVKPSIVRSTARSFIATADVAKGEATVTWEYRQRFVQGRRPEHELQSRETGPGGALPPGGLRNPQGEASEGGPNTETSSGAFRLDLKSGAVTPQEPGRGSVSISDVGRAMELPPVQQLSRVPQPQFLSADRKYVLSPKRAMDGSPWEKYIWTIYEWQAGHDFRQRYAGRAIQGHSTHGWRQSRFGRRLPGRGGRDLYVPELHGERAIPLALIRQ